MPVSAPRGGAIPGAGGSTLQWLKWVAGRPSEWQSRGLGVVGSQLLIAGCSTGTEAQPDQTFTYDVQDLTWLSHVADGTGPGRAPQYVSCVVGGLLCVFWCPDGTAPLTCSVLATESGFHWSAPDVQGAAPPVVKGFSATSDSKNAVVLFGGTGEKGGPSNAVYVLDLGDAPLEAPPVYFRLTCSGPEPAPRTQHAAVYLPAHSLPNTPNDSLLVFGGQASDGSFMNDMHVLDLSTSAWKGVPQCGAVPCGRMGHTLVRCGGFLVVHGGLGEPSEVTLDVTSVFCMKTLTWISSLDEGGEIPPPRYGAFAANCGTNKTVLFGGCDPYSNDPYFDVYCLVADVVSPAPAGHGQPQELPTPPQQAAGRRRRDEEEEWGAAAPAREGSLAPSPTVRTAGASSAAGQYTGKPAGEHQTVSHAIVDTYSGRDAGDAWDPDEAHATSAPMHGADADADAGQVDGLRAFDDELAVVAEEMRIGVDEDVERERDELRAHTQELLQRLHRAEQDVERQVRANTEAARRELEDEWEQRMREHEAEFKRERDALDAQAAALKEEQAQLKAAWDEHRAQQAADKQLWGEEKREQVRWGEEQAKALQAEKQELVALQQQLDTRERDMDAMLAARQEEIVKERAELNTLREEYEALLAARDEAAKAHTHTTPARTQQDSATPTRASPPRDAGAGVRSPPRYRDACSPGGTYYAAPADHALPDACIAFMSNVFREAVTLAAQQGLADEGSDRLPLAALFRLLKCGGLMRGPLTVDLVLDVVHAAHQAVHANTDMPEAVDEEVYTSVLIDVIHRLYASPGGGADAASAVDMTVVAHVLTSCLNKAWAPAKLRRGFCPDPAFDEIFTLDVGEVLHAHRDRLLALFQTFANCTGEALSPYEFMTTAQLLHCLSVMRMIPHLTNQEDVESIILPQVTEAIQELSPHELTEVICRVALLGFSDPASPAEKIERLVASEEMRAAAAPREQPPQQHASVPPAAATQPDPMAPPALHESQGQHQTPTRNDAPAPAPAPAASTAPTVSPIKSLFAELAAPKAAAHGTPPGGPQGSGGKQPILHADEVAQILKHKDALREELQKIYVYYASASVGGVGGCGLSQAKWGRFCTDTRCMPLRSAAKGDRPRGMNLLRKMDVDQIFFESIAESGGRGLLTFDGLMVALRRVSVSVYPSMAGTPHDALHHLLSECILPNASRVAAGLLHVDLMMTPDVEELLRKTRKQLALLHTAYTNAPTAITSTHAQPRGGFTASKFVKLFTDFKIVPSLLSNSEAGQVYLASKMCPYTGGAAAAAAPHLAHLHECLVRAAYVAFSKHPYAARLATPSAKLGELAERLMLTDPQGLRHQMEVLGLRVPPPGATSRGHTPPSRPTGMGAQRHPEVPLDDEDSLDRTLKQIFNAYSSPPGEMPFANFLKMCIDTKVAHRTEFPKAQVQSVFLNVSDGADALNFDEWCDALLLLGHARYPKISQGDALRTLLTSCVLPYAERRA